MTSRQYQKPALERFGTFRQLTRFWLIQQACNPNLPVGDPDACPRTS